jgi:hypothetical protein
MVKAVLPSVLTMLRFVLPLESIVVVKVDCAVKRPIAVL